MGTSTEAAADDAASAEAGAGAVGAGVAEVGSVTGGIGPVGSPGRPYVTYADSARATGVSSGSTAGTAVGGVGGGCGAAGATGGPDRRRGAHSAPRTPCGWPAQGPGSGVRTFSLSNGAGVSGWGVSKTWLDWASGLAPPPGAELGDDDLLEVVPRL